MPKCEWVPIVDCPTKLHTDCPIRLAAIPPLRRQLEIEKHWGTRTEEERSEYADLSGELGELANKSCRLWQDLLKELEWEKITPKQLAAVGAKKLY